MGRHSQSSGGDLSARDAGGDLGLFYHSNVGLEVVGVVEVVREEYPDPTDPTGRFVAVDVPPHHALTKPVTLAQMKAEPAA